MLRNKLVIAGIFCASLTASEMELVLDVGKDNTNLSAQSQAKIDSTESDTDKIVNEYKVVSKQVEGLKLYNAQKRIQIQAQLDLMDKYDEQLVQVVIMQKTNTTASTKNARRFREVRKLRYTLSYRGKKTENRLGKKLTF